MPLLEHRLEHVTREPRVFTQAAYGVSVPVAAVRNIDADVVARSADDIAQLLLDTEEHLKFVIRRREFELAHDAQSFPNHQFIVGGDSDVRTVAQHLLEKSRVIAIDDSHISICNVARFQVDPFAQSVVRPQVFQRADVVQGPPQVRLNHDTHVRKLRPQLTVDPQRVRRAGRVFHVDADEIIQLGGPSHEPARHVLTDARIEFESELCELHGNIRIDFLCVDLFEQVEIAAQDAIDLILAVDVLAQDVEGGPESASIEGGDHSQCLIRRFAGNISIGDPPDHAFGNGRQRARDDSIQQCHKRILGGMRKLLVLVMLLVVSASLGISDVSEKTGSEFFFARVQFSMDGSWVFETPEAPWHHDYPFSEDLMLSMVSELTGIRTTQESFKIVQLNSPEIFNYPWLYFSEPGFFSLSSKEIENFRNYLSRGGFVICDDFRGRDLEVLRSHMRKVLPGQEMFRLDASHPVFHSFYEISSLEMDPPYYDARFLGGKPEFWGLNDEKGRLVMVANQNNDLGEFMEGLDHGEKALKWSSLAVRLTINYLVYAMTH
jgi:hypothetical protein